MKPFQAHNIGYGLPHCNYYKVELVSKHGPCCYLKIGATDAADALLHATELRRDWLKEHGGFASHRTREIGQFQAVLS